MPTGKLSRGNSKKTHMHAHTKKSTYIPLKKVQQYLHSTTKGTAVLTFHYIPLHSIRSQASKVHQLRYIVTSQLYHRYSNFHFGYLTVTLQLQYSSYITVTLQLNYGYITVTLQLHYSYTLPLHHSYNTATCQIQHKPHCYRSTGTTLQQ